MPDEPKFIDLCKQTNRTLFYCIVGMHRMGARKKNEDWTEVDNELKAVCNCNRCSCCEFATIYHTEDK